MVVAFTLLMFVLPLIALLWWRLRRYERLVRKQQHDQAEQLSLLMHELVAELEHRGDTLINQIERKEEDLRVSWQRAERLRAEELQSVSEMASVPKNATAAAPLPPAEKASTHEAAPDEHESVRHPAARRQRLETRQAIDELLCQGLAADIIARRLKVGLGEVELAQNLGRWRSNTGQE